MRRLTWQILIGSCLLALAGILASAAAAQKHPFASRDAALKWMSDYRENPNPHLLPTFIKSLGRLGLLRDDQRSGIYFGFVGGVLADNQTKAAELLKDAFPLPPEHQIVVIRGLAYSGIPQWKNLLRDLAERMPARKRLIRTYIFGKGKTLEQLSFAAGPKVLDAWWGFYFATGSYHPALRIISAMKWAGEEEDLERLTVGSMAKWTLAQNATQDKYLLDFLRLEQAYQKPPIRKHLREVVLAAENFEVSALRRKTVASIDKLKKNGPNKWRKWSWWGRAGQLALTAGCVAASALGQIEFGLPCVIGGAASTGLLRLLDLQRTKPE